MYKFFLFKSKLHVCCIHFQILLITSTSSSCKWLVPGGGINSGEEPQDAAVREAREEAGAIGVVGRLLGIFEVSHCFYH